MGKIDKSIPVTVTHIKGLQYRVKGYVARFDIYLDKIFELEEYDT